MLTSKRLIVFTLIYFTFATSSQISIGAPDSPKVQAPTFQKVVHVTAPGGNDSRYMYIPFDVPAHAVRISVSYQYDRANGANTIDIGLFDARSTGSDTDPAVFADGAAGVAPNFLFPAMRRRRVICVVHCPQASGASFLAYIESHPRA